MQVAAMDDRIGIAEAPAERLVERDAGDLLGGQRIHQAQLVDIDRHGARRIADAQLIEGMERVRTQLDAGADLAQLGGLFQDDAASALARQAQGGGETADAGTGDQEGLAGVRHRWFPRSGLICCGLGQSLG